MAKILIIDDAEETRELVRRQLEGEHEVLALEGWVGANEIIFRQHPDLILLDVNLKSLKGDKLAEILMRTAKSKPLNIVLFSAMEETELQSMAKRVGVSGCIVKTGDEQLFRAQVRSFLR